MKGEEETIIAELKLDACMCIVSVCLLLCDCEALENETGLMAIFVFL